MVVKKSCVAAYPVGWPDGRGISGRMRVEWVVRCSWNGWPDDRGIRNLAGRHGVHCRIGSSEKLDWMREGAFFVHYRSPCQCFPCLISFTLLTNGVID